MTSLDTTTTPETADPEAVAGHVVGILNDGAICLLAGIGHRLGLFETLSSLPPATSTQVADAAGLDERYVREWLAGMATARFLGHDPDSGTFHLCPDHAPFLTGGGPDNLARMMPFISLLGQVAPKVEERFRHGGGLAYEDYPGFHELMASESSATHDALLLDTVLPLTGTVDALAAGIRVADLGCGQGHAVNLLARAFPASSFVGYDFSEEALAAARDEASRWGLGNATFEARDVATLDDDQGFDLVTAFDAIHDQAHPATVLGRIRASLRPGGTFLMVDMQADSSVAGNLDLPWASFLYTVSALHCMSVSLGQGGAGLGAAWGVQTAERMLREAGFSDVVRHAVEADPFNAYFVARA